MPGRQCSDDATSLMQLPVEVRAQVSIMLREPDVLEALPASPHRSFRQNWASTGARSSHLATELDKARTTEIAETAERTARLCSVCCRVAGFNA